MGAVNVTYSTGGNTIYGGRSAPVAVNELQFDSVAIVAEYSPLPQPVQNQIPVMGLHQSGGQVYTAGRQFLGNCSGRLAYEEHTQWSFRTTGSTSGAFNGSQAVTFIRPNSDYGTSAKGTKRQGWVGYVFRESPLYDLINFRRLDATFHYIKTVMADPSNPESVDISKLCLTGGSMGGWGTAYYGLRRPGQFAALYPDRPRWRWDDKVGEVDYATYDGGGINGTVANCPTVDPRDGIVGNVFDIHNGIAYVSDTTNFVPWIGWCIGENDTYMPFQDHIDMVAAMRAAGRPFAMAWNRGDHSAGSVMSKILASYPYGTFQIGKSYPHFTNHSRDVEPTIDDGLGAASTQATEGGINLGLAFRPPVETETGWACEVTSINSGVTTVDVRPYNCSTFKAQVAPQTVTIPGAKVWVTVSFTA